MLTGSPLKYHFFSLTSGVNFKVPYSGCKAKEEGELANLSSSLRFRLERN